MVGSGDFVAHRIVWSFVLLAVGVLVTRIISLSLLPTVAQVKEVVKDGELCGNLASAALAILVNWVVFVWAVNNDHTLDASLGYYICPHVVVLLGVCFLRERLHFIQWVAVALAAVGVFFMIRSSVSVPMVAIAIAFSFGLYALIKKRVPASPLTGLLLETGFLFVPALLYLYIRCPNDHFPWLNPWWLNLVLISSGLATVLPLALYATAVKHIKLSTMGLLQYIGPTIQFAIGVFMFGESFDNNRIIGFTCVWLGVSLFMIALLTMKPIDVPCPEPELEELEYDY